MLARTNRFHGHGSVLAVYKAGQVVRADGCSLHYRPNPRRRTFRLAVVVSRKVSKSAVRRNRIRRRVYELVRQTLEPDQAYDLIITVYDDKLTDIPADQLGKVIEKLLAKSRLASR